MDRLDGNLIDTDVLVIGGGAGGLMAALSAKRNGPPGTRVTLVDSWLIGRTGHTAFSNAWTIVALPGDDIDGILHEIVAGNDGIADQELVRQSLIDSHARLKDFEAMGMHFGRDEEGRYKRRPTRGLDLARVMYPEGGGLEFAWKLRLRAGARRRAAHRPAVHHRADARRRASASSARSASTAAPASSTSSRRATTIVATNAITFRSGFVRDITGTGTMLAYRAGAALRNAEFSYVRPGTPKFYFEGITFAIQEGAQWVNAKGEAFMADYEPEWGDEADVPRIARAMAMENRKGNAPLYLDMSAIPEARLRDYFIRSKVRWMDNFFRKLGEEAKTDMFGKTPYYALNQMTKMGIRTGAGLPLRRAGAAGGRPRAVGLRQPFRGLPHRALRRQRLDRRPQSAIEDLGPAAGAEARRRRGAGAARRDPRSLEGHGGGGVRPHPARPAGGHVLLRCRHPQARGPAA